MLFIVLKTCLKRYFTARQDDILDASLVVASRHADQGLIVHDVIRVVSSGSGLLKATSLLLVYSLCRAVASII